MAKLETIQAKFINIFLLLLIFSFSISSLNAYATDGTLTIENRTLGTATPIEDIKDLIYLLTNISNILIVNSDTMAPVLNKGDILLVSNNTSFDSLKIGDIIVYFRPEYDGSIIVSRVIDMTDKFGEKIIVTKGDTNEGLIPGTDFPIREIDYIGIVAYILPR